MTALERALADYLTIRRAMGYKLERAGRLLPRFVDYLAEHGADTVTTELALQWATAPPDASVRWRATRLSMVRGFAAYLHTVDATAEVPSADWLPTARRRATPYLYSDADLAALTAAAGAVRTPLRAATYQTLIGLLAVTGMRVGEAIALDRDDVDFAAGVLVVRHGKFDKARELPLHASTLHALRRYLGRGDRPNPPASRALLVSIVGTRLIYNNVARTFLELVRRASLRPRSTSCRPRPHDLRHSFAVRTLIDAYRTDGDVGPRVALLSTYLGHADPPTRTGTCRPHRSCCCSPASASSITWEASGERARTDAAGIPIRTRRLCRAGIRSRCKERC
jgi:integrase/recombinase XerD